MEGLERELGWNDVVRELEAGRALCCYRISMASAVVAGSKEGRGVAMDNGWRPEGTWAELSLALSEKRGAKA